MTNPGLATAQRLLAQAVNALAALVGSGDNAELVSTLTTCESAARQLERVAVDAVAALDRRGGFTERGYKSATQALTDLLGCERFEAHRRVAAAEQVAPRTGLDGATLPPRLPATADGFAQGRTSLRHVEVITRLLNSAAAGRLSPEAWAGAEVQLAGWAGQYTPRELHEWGKALVETLDQDGAEPDDRPPARVNELFLSRLPDGGGKIKGRFDDAAMFDAIAAVIDAKAKPLTADDDRPLGQRQAEALADVCGYVLDHGDVPECGGRRPHMNVLIRLEDLQNRARAACLDFGGTVSPESLRMLCCDAAVVPIVMDGKGQPLDVGPDHPHHPRRPAPRGGRSGPRMRPPRLRATGILDRMPSHSSVGTGRRDETVEPGPSVQGSSPADPFQRMVRPDPRRTARVHPAEMDRLRTTPQTTSTSPSRRSVRRRVRTRSLLRPAAGDACRPRAEQAPA